MLPLHFAHPPGRGTSERYGHNQTRHLQLGGHNRGDKPRLFLGLDKSRRSFSEGRFASGTLRPRLQGSLLPVDEAELCSVCSHLMYRIAASPKAKVQMYLTITAGRYFCFSPSTFGFPQFSIRRQTRQTTSQVHTLRCLRQSRF